MLHYRTLLLGTLFVVAAVHNAVAQPVTGKISPHDSTGNRGNSVTSTPWHTAPDNSPVRELPYRKAIAEESKVLAAVTAAFVEMFPTEEFLHVLPSSGRKALLELPPGAKRSSNNAYPVATKGAPLSIPTWSEGYATDSSISAVAAWYARTYGFQIKTASVPLTGARGEVLYVARAVKRFGNTIISIMIWNLQTTPTTTTHRKNAAKVARTAISVQERTFRSRNELVVTGPDAVVAFEWGVPYADLITEVSARYMIDPYLIAALLEQESGFNPNACSVDSALGLAQLIPATAEFLGVTDPLNPEQAIDGGVRYLAMMLLRYSNNLELALAAYNAGPGNVDRYKGIPPFRETQRYVQRILKRYQEKVLGRSSST